MLNKNDGSSRLWDDDGSRSNKIYIETFKKRNLTARDNKVPLRPRSFLAAFTQTIYQEAQLLLLLIFAIVGLLISRKSFNAILLTFVCLLLVQFAIRYTETSAIRHFADKIDGKTILRVDAIREKAVTADWQDLAAGDVILIQAGEEVPCDCLLLSTAHKQGIGFFTSSSFDNLGLDPVRQSCRDTRNVRSMGQACRLAGYVSWETHPNPITTESIKSGGKSQFKAIFKLKDYPRPCDVDIVNVVFKGESMVGTDWAFALCLFVGPETYIARSNTWRPYTQYEDSVTRLSQKIAILGLIWSILNIAFQFANKYYFSSEGWLYTLYDRMDTTKWEFQSTISRYIYFTPVFAVLPWNFLRLCETFLLNRRERSIYGQRMNLTQEVGDAAKDNQIRDSAGGSVVSVSGLTRSGQPEQTLEEERGRSESETSDTNENGSRKSLSESTGVRLINPQPVGALCDVTHIIADANIFVKGRSICTGFTLGTDSYGVKRKRGKSNLLTTKLPAPVLSEVGHHTSERPSRANVLWDVVQHTLAQYGEQCPDGRQAIDTSKVPIPSLNMDTLSGRRSKRVPSFSKSASRPPTALNHDISTPALLRLAPELTCDDMRRSLSNIYHEALVDGSRGKFLFHFLKCLSFANTSLPKVNNAAEKSKIRPSLLLNLPGPSAVSERCGDSIRYSHDLRSDDSVLSSLASYLGLTVVARSQTEVDALVNRTPLGHANYNKLDAKSYLGSLASAEPVDGKSRGPRRSTHFGPNTEIEINISHDLNEVESSQHTAISPERIRFHILTESLKCVKDVDIIVGYVEGDEQVVLYATGQYLSLLPFLGISTHSKQSLKKRILYQAAQGCKTLVAGYKALHVSEARMIEKCVREDSSLQIDVYEKINKILAKLIKRIRYLGIVHIRRPWQDAAFNRLLHQNVNFEGASNEKSPKPTAPEDNEIEKITTENSLKDRQSPLWLHELQHSDTFKIRCILLSFQSTEGDSISLATSTTERAYDIYNLRKQWQNLSNVKKQRRRLRGNQVKKEAISILDDYTRFLAALGPPDARNKQPCLIITNNMLKLFIKLQYLQPILLYLIQSAELTVFHRPEPAQIEGTLRILKSKNPLTVRDISICGITKSPQTARALGKCDVVVGVCTSGWYLEEAAKAVVKRPTLMGRKSANYSEDASESATETPQSVTPLSAPNKFQSYTDLALSISCHMLVRNLDGLINFAHAVAPAMSHRYEQILLWSLHTQYLFVIPSIIYDFFSMGSIRGFPAWLVNLVPILLALVPLGYIRVVKDFTQATFHQERVDRPFDRCQNHHTSGWFSAILTAVDAFCCAFAAFFLAKHVEQNSSWPTSGKVLSSFQSMIMAGMVCASVVRLALIEGSFYKMWPVGGCRPRINLIAAICMSIFGIICTFAVMTLMKYDNFVRTMPGLLGVLQITIICAFLQPVFKFVHSFFISSTFEKLLFASRKLLHSLERRLELLLGGNDKVNEDSRVTKVEIQALMRNLNRLDPEPTVQSTRRGSIATQEAVGDLTNSLSDSRWTARFDRSKTRAPKMSFSGEPEFAPQAIVLPETAPDRLIYDDVSVAAVSIGEEMLTSDFLGTDSDAPEAQQPQNDEDEVASILSVNGGVQSLRSATAALLRRSTARSSDNAQSAMEVVASQMNWWKVEFQDPKLETLYRYSCTLEHTELRWFYCLYFAGVILARGAAFLGRYFMVSRPGPALYTTFVIQMILNLAVIILSLTKRIFVYFRLSMYLIGLVTAVCSFLDRLNDMPLYSIWICHSMWVCIISRLWVRDAFMISLAEIFTLSLTYYLKPTRADGGSKGEGNTAAFSMFLLINDMGSFAFMAVVCIRLAMTRRLRFLSNYRNELSKVKKRDILTNMLPAFVVDKILKNGVNELGVPNGMNAICPGTVTVIFCDVYDFQNLVKVLEPTQLVSLLDSLFLYFDRLVDTFDVIKIETVFETYLSCSGLKRDGTGSGNDDTQRDTFIALDFALTQLLIVSGITYNIRTDLQPTVAGAIPDDAKASQASERRYRRERLHVKIGMNTGTVTAGVVGGKKPQYALFGDTVNTASRMKLTGEKDHIHVSDATWEFLRRDPSLQWLKQTMPVKGKGVMDTYLLTKVGTLAYPDYADSEDDEWLSVEELSLESESGSDKSNNSSNSVEEQAAPVVRDAKTQPSVASRASPTNTLEQIPRQDVESIRENYISMRSVPLESHGTVLVRPRVRAKGPCDTITEHERRKNKDSSRHISLLRRSRNLRVLNAINKGPFRKHNRALVQTVALHGSASSAFDAHLDIARSESFNDDSLNDRNLLASPFDRAYHNPYSTFAERRQTWAEVEQSRQQISPANESTSKSRQSTRNIPASGEGALDELAIEKAMQSQSKSTLLCNEQLNRFTMRWKNRQMERDYQEFVRNDSTHISYTLEALIIFLLLRGLTAITRTYSRYNADILEIITRQPANPVTNMILTYWISRSFELAVGFVSWCFLHSLRRKKRSQRRADFGKDLSHFASQIGTGLYSYAVLAFVLLPGWQFTASGDSTVVPYWDWATDFVEFTSLMIILHHNTGFAFSQLVLFDLFIVVLLIIYKTLVVRDSVAARLTIMVMPQVIFLMLLSCYYKESVDRLSWFIVNRSGQDDDRAKEMLVDMLPKQVLEEFQADQLKLAYSHNEITFLFADIVGFTNYSSSVTPEEVVNLLQRLFAAFDKDSTKFNLFKLCTIGDAYVAVSDPPTDRQTNYDPTPGLINVWDMTQAMLGQINKIRHEVGVQQLNMRIGCHLGSCVGGVIGSGRIRYDFWGMDVLIGNSMESNGKPGKINVSETWRKFVESHLPMGTFEFEFNKTVDVQGEAIDCFFATEQAQLSRQRVLINES